MSPADVDPSGEPTLRDAAHPTRRRVLATGALGVTSLALPPAAAAASPLETAQALAGDSTLVLYLDAGIRASYGGTGSTWTDLSSLGKDATLYDATHSVGPVAGGGYFSFTGEVGSYAATAALPDMGNWSIECWVRVPGGAASLDGRTTAIVTDEFNVGVGVNPVLKIEASKISPGFFSYSGSAAWRQTAGHTPADTGWHHHVGSLREGTLRHYVDGVEVASAAASGPKSSGLGFRIARRWDPGAGESDLNHAPIDIGMIRVSYDGRTAAEVLANYDATKWRYPA